MVVIFPSQPTAAHIIHNNDEV